MARTVEPQMATELVVTTLKVYHIHIFRSQTPAMVCLPEEEITVAVSVSLELVFLAVHSGDSANFSDITFFGDVS
ncbi:hypothetical protein P8452_47266 [Trifolium repens]|jgi:hypothetical protein|nr:hypothetical protein P8452_47266 [Trifolium repens]